MFSFSTALELLKEGRSLTRVNWDSPNPNIAKRFINMQVPNEHSKMTMKYLYLHIPAKGYYKDSLMPWTPNQEDLMTEDWQLADML